MTRLVVDSRALSAYRIVLGLILLFDLARWSRDLPFFLGPDGPLPLGSLVADSAGGGQAWSLYNGSCYSLYPYFLFLATVLAALAITLGWRSRTACALLIPLLLSLQNRAAIALDRADILELACLLSGALLPWDELWSLRPSAPLTGRLAAYAPGAALLLQALLWQELALQFWWGGASLWWCLALTLSPLPLLASHARLRFLVLLVPATAFLRQLPTNELLPWLGLMGLLPWLGAGILEAPAQHTRQARLSAAVLFLSLTGASCALGYLFAASSALSESRAFLALGPRAPSPSPNTWLAIVARAPRGGKDWNVLDPKQPVCFDRPERPYAGHSYRQGLYLSSLQRQGNWGLRYWLAYSFYNRERRQKGPGRAGPTRVEVYRCTEASGAPPSAVLFSRWPMQD